MLAVFFSVTNQLHANVELPKEPIVHLGTPEHPGTIDPLMLAQIIMETENELNSIYADFQRTDRTLNAQLWKVETELQKTKRFQKRKHINLLNEKICIEEAMAENTMNAETNSLKVRYRKGIDLIKLLYEKILALDHHFTGMQTYQNIILLSNPHTYPEFQKIQSVIEGRLKKGAAIKLPPILETNPYLSATFSIAGTLLGSGSKSEKQQELDDISCILDFTVRMNSDLSVIQHETEYLKTSNQNLKKECEKLFADYTKVIKYIVPIEQCRENDDWEKVYDNLDGLINAISHSSSAMPSNSGYPGQGGGTGYGNSSGYNSGYNSGSGYGNTGSGYGNSGTGYGSTGTGYGNSGTDYGNSGSGYGNSGTGYGNSGTGYGSSGSGYGSTGNGYGNSGSGYGNTGSGYGNTGNGYGNSGYGSNSGYDSGYGNSGGYDNSGYGAGGYGNTDYNNSGYGNYNNNGGYNAGNQNGYNGNGGMNNNPGGMNNNGLSNRELDRARIDLEFSTQRVAEFITSYNNFVTQGTQYYQKFDNIVSTYENEDACQGKLPRQFGELKFDIKSTIEKFNNTYNLPEIQGSRMRDLLYGMEGN